MGYGKAQIMKGGRALRASGLPQGCSKALRKMLCLFFNTAHGFCLPRHPLGAALALAFAFLPLCAFPALAVTGITLVELDIGPEENPEEDYAPGDIISGLEPLALDDSYTVYNYSLSSNYNTPRQSYSYTMDIRAADGYEFDETCVVEVRGAYELSISSSNAERIRLVARAYPYYILENVSDIERDDTEYYWSKVDYATGYDVIIYYEDESKSDEQSARKSTTVPKISISSYDTDRREITGFYVRAKCTESKSSGYVLNSLYVDEYGQVAEDMDEDYKFSVPTSRVSLSRSSSSSSRSSSSSTSSSSSSSSSASWTNPVSSVGAYDGPGLSPDVNTSSQTIGVPSPFSYGNWVQSGADWYYSEGGVYRTGWINPAGTDYYYMGTDGKMKSGWQYIDGYWYYLNPEHDGTFGRMLVYWQSVYGQWYYLNPSWNGPIPYGALYMGRETPDGHYVDKNGAMVQ